MKDQSSENKLNPNIQQVGERNDFLDDDNENLDSSKVSKGLKKSQIHENNEGNKDEQNEQDQIVSDKPQNSEGINIQEKSQQSQGLSNLQNQKHLQNDMINQNIRQKSQQKNTQSSIIINQNKNILIPHPNIQKKKEIKVFLSKLQKQLKDIQLLKSKSTSNQKFQQNQRQINNLQQQIAVLQIKLRLLQKMQKQKQLTSIDRINHLDHIFKHYCTHIFKTGKHMTFDRLEYEKVHLTIDRFFIFLKDFNLTSIKAKDGKIREIIDKQEIIKLFKKVSTNCKDLNFEQFIIMIEKLGEVYFDSKLTYQQRKLNQREQRVKIKQNIQKKEKMKQQMLKKHKQRMQNLQRVVQTVDSNPKAKIQTQGAQNDDLIEELMKQNKEPKQQQKQENVEIVQEAPQKDNLKNQFIQPLTNPKTKKSTSLYAKTFKKQPLAQDQKGQQKNPLLVLSKHEKREYFYEVINIDDAQSFMNKLRQLNLPLFKIYASQNAKDKDTTQSKKKDQRPDDVIIIKKQQQEEEKRLKQLRQKLNERNQKLKHSSVPLLSKQEYDQRKLKRSRMQLQSANLGLGLQDKKKSTKIDLKNTEINLQFLSKLSYQNVNYTKFDPRNLFSKQQDDKIFMKQYDDSPTIPRKLTKNFTQISRITQNSKRIMEQKQKISSSFLQKLKQRQSQVEINQKKQQISQLYRFNDKTQRQKRLVDKFLQKNH